MYISIPIFILILIVLSYCHRQMIAEFVAEMRDPDGVKRQAVTNAKAASKAARKRARGPMHAVVGGIALLGAVLGGAWLLWGSLGAIWAAWLVAGPFIVAPAMLTLRRWFYSCTDIYK